MVTFVKVPATTMDNEGCIIFLTETTLYTWLKEEHCGSQDLYIEDLLRTKVPLLPSESK